MDRDEYTDEEWEERVEMFADPGGNSALRAASASNPRNLDCPTCGAKNVLTPADARRGYQCNRCADADEGIGFGMGYGS
jgi:hypothetical protein